MGLRRYLNQKKERSKSMKEDEKRFKKILKQDEERFIEDIKKIYKDEPPNEEEILNVMNLEIEESEKFNQLINNQMIDIRRIDDERITKDTIIDPKRLDDAAYYQKIMKRIDKLTRRKHQFKFATVTASLLFLFWMLASYSSQANPFQFLIQVAHYIDGKISVKPNVEYDENAELDFEVYQVGYMTEDYVLMDEFDFDKIYKMNYNKDPKHFVTIDQSPIYDNKTLSQTDKAKYQTIIEDGVEYLYNIDSLISTLYFVKEDTSIFIRGTIEKEEILHIAKNLYKE